MAPTQASSRTTSGQITIDVPGGRVGCLVAGTGRGTPLLVLHGGPGLGHDYLEPLNALGADRPVVFFDQVGSPGAEFEDDTSLWRLERFVTEVDAVRHGLGLDRCHVFGHSFGGWLALEYTLHHPARVASLILASASASIREYVDHLRRLKAAMPTEDIAVLDRCAAIRDFENTGYTESLMRFMRRHICRLDPWPDALLRSFQNYQRSPAPAQLMGPDYFTPDGTLAGWDREADLRETRAATLVTCGRFDSIGPPCAETLVAGLPHAEMQVFENSSHMPHLEETDEYLRALRGFLDRTDT